ncbi:MAG TPA: glycosyltransferase [Pyrinomonadaceae bacterium]|jgi:glycosyltransferase involved in cell wall biosynthesis
MRVTVGIPSFNHARFLPQTIESVLAQTYQGFEIIIVDDCSTDESRAVIESFAARHPSIRSFFNEQNAGTAATANRTIAEATGEFWAGMGSDDVWLPDKLEKQIAYMDAHPQTGLVYGLAGVIDEHGNKSDEVLGRDISHNPVAELIEANHIPALTAMVRRQAFERVGLHSSIAYSDWELWVRLANHFSVGFIDSVLGFYRVHQANMSLGKNGQIATRREIEVLRSLRPTINAPRLKQRIRELEHRLANLLMEEFDVHAGEGELLRALDCFGRALRLDPSRISNVRRLFFALRKGIS